MTTTLKKPAAVQRRWYLIDAQRHTLGRLSTRIARYLMGKQHLDFTPHVDMGDYVVVINASGIKLTGKKIEQKRYTRFSGYPGGITAIPMKDLLANRPDYIIQEAVRRMLPKNKLRRLQMRRLYVVADNKHRFKIDETIT